MSKEKSDEPNAWEDAVAPGETGAFSGRAVGSCAVAVHGETPAASAGSLFLYSKGGVNPFC